MLKILVKVVGGFSLASLPILVWSWVMGWLPESTHDGVVIGALFMFLVLAAFCLIEPSRKE